MQNTEGLPLGARIKRVDYSAMCLNWYAELEPDNVYGVLDLETVKIPDGYKRVEKDWFRVPVKSERFLNSAANQAFMYTGNLMCEDERRIILEPIKRTRTVAILEYEVTDRITHPQHITREQAEKWVTKYPELNARIEERPI